MELSDLVAFAKGQNEWLKERGAGKTERERLYAQTVKLGEEFGELCDAILARDGEQRPEKLSEASDDALAAELADVALVVFILAHKLGINLPEALQKKMAALEARHTEAAR